MKTFYKTCFKLLLCIIVFTGTTHINAQWSELGGMNGLAANGPILSICKDFAGNLYAGGDFTNVNNKKYIAKWNEVNWNELGGTNSLSANNFINSICTDATNNVYAGGNFTNNGGYAYVAKYNGNNWSGLGNFTALNLQYTISSDSSGNLYRAANFINPTPNYYVAKWDGSNWIELGIGSNSLSANNYINCICTDVTGNVYVAGNFTNTNGNYYVAKWNGTNWSELGGTNSLTINNHISSISTDGLGNVYVSGFFTNNNGKYYVAKWDGSNWIELGTGINSLSANNYITSICTNSMGDVYVSGFFTNTNGKYYVAKWDGNTWSELGGTNALAANSSINSICSDAAGNIYAAGNFTNTSGKYYVAKYSPPCIPTSSTNTQVACDSFYWADKHQWYYANNITDTVHLINVGGCDSLVTLNLNITNSTTSLTTTTSCDSLWWNGVKYTSSGTYTWHGTNAANCDSTATLNLTINHSASSIFTTSSCGSYTWALNSKVYTSSNHTDTVHLATASGCDSLITLDLTILSNITDVHINGVGAFCGDTATTQLSTNINSTYGSVTYEWIRLGYDETTWQVVSTDSVANVSDVYPAQYVVKTVIAGCGTFYSNQQTVMPVKSPTLALNPSPITSICNNNIVNFSASSADSGVNNYAFYNGNSVVQNGATLTYNTPTLTTANSGAIYTVEATNLMPTFDGNITENFWGKPLAVSTGGPASSFGAGHELNAVYARADANNVYLAIAGNVQNGNRIMVFIDSKSGGYNNGNYGRTGLGNNAIKNFNSGSIFDPGFNADYCLGIGTDATTSQYYFDLFTLGGTASGGGGTNNYIGSNLSPVSGYSIGANPANSSQTNGFEVAIPKSAIGYTSGDVRIFLLYSADNGFLSNQFLTRAKATEGNYGNGIVNFALATPSPIDIPVGSLQTSCKTTVATTVTVKPNLTSTTTQSACDSLVWNGTTYKTSGTYTFTSTGSNGCDSIASLDLTINHPTTSTTTTSNCDSLLWNGTTYYASGTYTYTTTNASGCDSVATLNLTINHPTTSTTTTSSCDSMLWGNTTYYTSGTYTYTTTGSNGCDSVATLNLTINNAPAKPTIISYPTGIILAGTTGYIFTCSSVPNAVSYQWFYTGGGATINNNGDTTVSVDFANIAIGVMQVVAISVNGCTSASDTITIGVVVQPVVLSNFTAEKINNTVTLKWRTATEVNSKNFEVQRSTNGNNFETIGIVYAKGFASNYSLIDAKPYAGVNYYRLKQLDNDGKFEYSATRTVNFKSDVLNVSIYPNPVTNVLNVYASSGKIKQISIINTLGKVVYTTSIVGANGVTQIPVSNLSEGTYFVEIISNETKIVEKFIKK